MKMVHLTINVRDLDRSIAFYEEVARIMVRTDLRKFGKPIVFLSDEGETTSVELVCDPENGFRGSGISVGFSSDDIEGDHARLVRLGYAVTDIMSPDGRTRFFFLNDPDGVRVQIIQ